MIEDSEDRQFRALFYAELATDATDTPEFATVWAAAAQRHDSRVRMLRALALAAALSIGATIEFFSRSPVKPTTPVAGRAFALESRELPWRSAILLTEWRAPSDALLPAKLEP